MLRLQRLFQADSSLRVMMLSCGFFRALEVRGFVSVLLLRVGRCPFARISKYMTPRQKI